MWWVSTKRVLKAGFVGFLRNGFVSLASILMMVVTLFVVGSLLFLGGILDASLTELKKKVDVNVYFVTSAGEGEILALKSSLEALPEVAEVSYTTREEALAAFKERHKSDQLTIQALEELGENPLGASLAVRAKETEQYEAIAKFLGGDTALSKESLSIIDKVNYFQNKTAIDKLTDIVGASERIGIVLTVILIFASALITLNTIRLAIYTAKDEIAVMKLVGASNMYIRGPFIFAGILYGLLAALATLVLFYPLTLSLGPATQSFFGSINIFDYYLENFVRIFLIILLSGVLLGGASSFLAVHRYLKV